MWILGLNAYHGDASACLVRDGALVAAAEEERFRRVKHWAGFPSEAIRYCLAEGGIGIEQVDHVAVNRDPGANLLRKALFTLAHRPSLSLVRDRARNRSRIARVRARVVEQFGSGFRGEVVNVEHHRAHLASAFFVSPFERAAVASVDGFGDFVSTMVGRGEGSTIGVHDRVFFPHSLGLFYLAVTQHLGFPNYGDEYKVMGLAAYGEPEFLDKMRRVVRLERGGRFRLDLDFFIHHKGGVSMTWEEGPPEMGPVYSDGLTRLLGPPRGKDEPIDDRHRNVAASAQAMYEEAFFHVLDRLHDRTKEKNLALAGGCAMNSVANGKIYARTPFERIYVQAAAGDAGGAIGAAFHVWHDVLGKPRSFVINRADLGPQYANATIGAVIEKRQGELAAGGCRIEEIGDEAVLLARAAAAISAGKVVGWFQGRMEWGPRALGHRSIVCDPRRSDMKDILNLKIKRRESFRPFAPSILREAVPEYFETDDDVPFMLQVYKIRPEKRPLIPAVTHVDGTGRLQTVTEAGNGRYYRLIKAFERETGIPIVLNTSFNENEPIVNGPEQALDCFLRTRMDVLVLGDRWVERANGESVNRGGGNPPAAQTPLRILFLNRFFYPDQSATSQMLTDLAEELALRGHAVTVIAGALTHGDAPERLPAFETRRGIEIRRARTTRFGRGGMLARLADYASFFPSAFLVSLRVPNVDVVVALSDPPLVPVLGALAAKAKRARFVHWAHDIYPEVAVAAGVLKRNSPWTRALDRVSRWALSRADRVVALGEDMARRLAEKGVDRDKISVIPNWADGEAIRPCPIEENGFRREQGWNGKFVVMYSGNIGLAHDFHPVLEAAKGLLGDQNVLIAFIGGGSRLSEVRSYVSGNRLANVVFLPHQDRGLLSQTLTAADLHVVALAKEMKGLVVPSKLYGVMAAGRPILFVGPLDSDIAAAIEEGGFGATAGDGPAVGAAIRRLAADVALCRSMGRKAREAFEAAFTREKCVAAFEAAIAETAAAG